MFLGLTVDNGLEWWVAPVAEAVFLYAWLHWHSTEIPGKTRQFQSVFAAVAVAWAAMQVRCCGFHHFLSIQVCQARRFRDILKNKAPDHS